ncbi:MAG: hypothetical protein ACFFKA_12835 [Candidatus Thorarchaeota archaeon]
MEKKTKLKSKTYLGLIVAVLSLIGLVFAITFPLGYNPILLAVCVVLLVGITILTKGLIERRFEKLYWIIFLFAGILTFISLFTPESYNQLIVPIITISPSTSLPDVSWLWDLRFGAYFQLTEVFFLTLVLMATGGIIYISIKSFNHFENILNYSRFLKASANFLIISSIFLYVGKMIITPAVIELVIAITPGFALVGPFFMGLMVKTQLKVFRNRLNIPLNEYQEKRNNVAYAYTILGGYGIIILSAVENMFVSFNQSIAIIPAALAFVAVVCALVYPRGGIILLITTGVIVAIKTLFISIAVFRIPLDLLIILLLLPDLNKTRKLVKLAKNH